eukprot:1766413-Pyramimonas_sp.AAC.1
MLAAIRGGPYGGDKLAAAIAQLRAFKARSDMLAKQVLSVARSANARSWKEWVDNALDKGATAARKFIRERTKWEPDTVVIEGNLTASIQSTLDTYRAKFGKFGDPAAEPLHRGSDLHGPIGIPTADALRDLSKSYGKASAVSLDGLHVRHLSMLSEEALEAFASNIYVSEATPMGPRGAFSESSRWLQTHRSISHDAQNNRQDAPAFRAGLDCQARLLRSHAEQGDPP